MPNHNIVNPHFKVPFQFHNGSALCVDQDSDEDILQCVSAIVRTPRGFRIELPDFGVPSQVLAEDPKVSEVERALELYEPRARYHLTKAQLKEALSILISIGVETDNG